MINATDGGEPVGEGSPFDARCVRRCLGALGPGNGGGCELPGGFLPCLAGSLDRGGLPFGLSAGGQGVLSGLAGGGRVRGSALCADGDACHATPSTAGGRRVWSGDAAKTGEPLALSYTDW